MSARRRAIAREITGARAGDAVCLRGDGAHHLARVLRVRPGDAVVLFDGAGLEAPATVARLEARGGAAVVELTLAGDPAPGVGCDRARVTWLQGVPKGDKLETVVRQATELGARAVWPVYTDRSVPRPGAAAERARAERLAAVARSAAAQSGRADVPEVRAAVALAEALSAVPTSAALRLVPWEGGGRALGEVLAAAPRDAACAVLVGPEGGLAVAEVDLARAHGFVPVDLGPRVLRTETVAPALLGILAVARGDLRAPG